MDNYWIIHQALSLIDNNFNYWSVIGYYIYSMRKPEKNCCKHNFHMHCILLGILIVIHNLFKPLSL